MVWPSRRPHRDDTIGPRGRSATLLTRASSPRSGGERPAGWELRRPDASGDLRGEALGAAAGPAVGRDLLADAGGGAVGRDLVVPAAVAGGVEEGVRGPGGGVGVVGGVGPSAGGPRGRPEGPGVRA